MGGRDHSYECAVCDRAECRSDALNVPLCNLETEAERNVARRAWSEAYDDCRAHRVDWRARALRAEAALVERTVTIRGVTCWNTPDRTRTATRIDVDGEPLLYGEYHGEPEDLIKCRDLSWVEDALANLAHALGAKVHRYDGNVDSDDEYDAIVYATKEPNR